MRLDKQNMKVAVLCGGFEPENYSSRLTGNNILTALKNGGFKRAYKLEVSSNILNDITKGKPDFAFLAMFCKWGEDGVIQSLLEILDIPYSGSGVETSALCKNKYFFNRYVKGLGLMVAEPYFYGNAKEFNKFDKIAIIFPSIVKAVYQGYSLGTSLINNMHELTSAIKKAFQFSSKITIEEYIEGRELTIGIIDIPKKGPVVLPIIEIKFKRHKIQDTEVKDNPDFIEEIVPAKFTKKELTNISSQTLYLYNKLGCLGVARFDVRQRSDGGNLYFLENNTCPGIVDYQHSDLPKQLKAIGITLEQFVEYMVVSGLKRPKNKLEYLC